MKFCSLLSTNCPEIASASCSSDQCITNTVHFSIISGWCIHIWSMGDINYASETSRDVAEEEIINISPKKAPRSDLITGEI